MIETKCITRKWGNSIGITIPKDVVEREGIKENEEVTALICKHGNVLKETFGTAKITKSTGKLMRQIDKELYNE